MAHSDSGITLVTGSGGTLGKLVVSELQARGHRVRGVGRQAAPDGFPGDWVTCDLTEKSPQFMQALEGVTSVIHCASSLQVPADDLKVVQNLISGIGTRPIRVVFVSIAGIDRSAAVLEYYKFKIACETALRESGIPQVTVRISQFHPFIEVILSQMVRGPFIFRPNITFQPVDMKFAAQQLVNASQEPLSRPLINVHGPERLSTKELIKEWSAVTGRRYFAIPIPAVGLLKGFALLEPVAGRTGGLTWRQWLKASRDVPNPYMTYL